jgi:hypothetical protein
MAVEASLAVHVVDSGANPEYAGPRSRERVRCVEAPGFSPEVLSKLPLAGAFIGGKRMHFVRDKRDKPPAGAFIGGKRMHFVRDKRDKPPAGAFMAEKECTLCEISEISPTRPGVG